jgi:methylenetetrahydrofolate dehydrogenase (NADP+)/methenyltetrahydrofolate cyclohydrolase
MLVDGKAIAADILERVRKEVEELPKAPRLAVVTCAPNFATKKYLEMKKQKAASVGIALKVVELPKDSPTEEVVACVEKVAKDSEGVVVQLPLPAEIDREVVLQAVPVDKDPDGFSYGQSEAACLPPVAGAIDEISKLHNIDWRDKTVVVLGGGRLVGQPALEYARQSGAKAELQTKETFDEVALKQADIIVSGIGQAHFIKPSMVKDDVVVFDAGTSEDNGVLAGDADLKVAERATLLTPVPGGIGPITIAYLLHNLVSLAQKN